jgi:hypothetical protein
MSFGTVGTYAARQAAVVRGVVPRKAGATKIGTDIVLDGAKHVCSVIIFLDDLFLDAYPIINATVIGFINIIRIC